MNRYAILILLSLLASGCAGHRWASLPNSRTARETIHFDFDRASIRSEEKEKLGRVAATLKSDSKPMAILEGHTDRIGGTRYNEILAENRARAVRAYLWTLGVDPSLTTMLSNGKREPIATGNTKRDHQLNRRVEIFMTLTSPENRRRP